MKMYSVFISGHFIGEFDMSVINKDLKDFEGLAKDLLDKNKADHVVYASKSYTKDGDIDCVRFYNPPIELSDKEFYNRTEKNPDYIYALHNNK